MFPEIIFFTLLRTILGKQFCTNIIPQFSLSHSSWLRFLPNTVHRCGHFQMPPLATSSKQTTPSYHSFRLFDLKLLQPQINVSGFNIIYCAISLSKLFEGITAFLITSWLSKDTLEVKVKNKMSRFTWIITHLQELLLIFFLIRLIYQMICKSVIPFLRFLH